MNDNHIADERPWGFVHAVDCNYTLSDDVNAKCTCNGIAPRADADTAGAKPDCCALVPVRMTAAMINAWSGGKTVTTDEVAYRTPFQEAWKRVLAAATPASSVADATHPLRQKPFGYVSPEASVADAAGAKRFERYDWDGKENEYGALVFFADVLEALSIVDSSAAGASERADAEKDAALTDKQIDAGIKAWFGTPMVRGVDAFRPRMRAAIEAAILAANKEKP